MVPSSLESRSDPDVADPNQNVSRPKAPLPGSSSHAAGFGARIMPWKQAGDWLINILIASIAPRLDPRPVTRKATACCNSPRLVSEARAEVSWTRTAARRPYGMLNPYGMLRGAIEIDWRGNNLHVIFQDEVRAARAEGSCLGILDLIREAERSQTFRSRRISHQELHETFQERWEIILAMATDSEASDLQLVICQCTHLLNKPEQFQRDFPLPPNHTAQQWQELRGLGDSLGIRLKTEGVVQQNALEYLKQSTHATEGHMRVLLDWPGHNLKVAVLNLFQIPNENGTPQFFHSSVVDLINDEAVLLLKVLNLKKHGRERAGLNHFNRVSGREPVEFQQDFLPVEVANKTSPLGSRELRLHMAQHGEPGSATNDVTTRN